MGAVQTTIVHEDVEGVLVSIPSGNLGGLNIFRCWGGPRFEDSPALRTVMPGPTAKEFYEVLNGPLLLHNTFRGWSVAVGALSFVTCIALAIAWPLTCWFLTLIAVPLLAVSVMYPITRRRTLCHTTKCVVGTFMRTHCPGYAATVREERTLFFDGWRYYLVLHISDPINEPTPAADNEDATFLHNTRRPSLKEDRLRDASAREFPMEEIGDSAKS